MNLRPHHILCIQKFTGHGYNAAFTAHMSSIVSQLTDRHMTQITVTQGCDDLCNACPNNISGKCASLEKVSMMDSAVLEICNLTYGVIAPWDELAHKARERIFAAGKFHRVCSCCQWLELCKNTEVSNEYHK